MSTITISDEPEEIAQDIVRDQLDWFFDRSRPARRRRLLKKLDDCGKRSEVSDELLAVLQDPWRLLLYVLSSGVLGQPFDNEQIARMVQPYLNDITGTSWILRSTLTEIKRSVDSVQHT